MPPCVRFFSFLYNENLCVTSLDARPPPLVARQKAFKAALSFVVKTCYPDPLPTPVLRADSGCDMSVVSIADFFFFLEKWFAVSAYE